MPRIYEIGKYTSISAIMNVIKVFLEQRGRKKRVGTRRRVPKDASKKNRGPKCEKGLSHFFGWKSVMHAPVKMSKVARVAGFFSLAFCVLACAQGS